MAAMAAMAAMAQGASFFCGCLTAVKKRSKGCSARARASAKAKGVAGKRGAETNQEFSSWVAEDMGHMGSKSTS